MYKFFILLLALPMTGCATGVPVITDKALQKGATQNEQTEVLNQPRSEDSEPEEAYDLEEFCVGKPCRANVLITLDLKDGDRFEYSSPLEPPVVMENYISVYAGEELYVEADVMGDELVNLSHVKTVTDASRTITFKFVQLTEMSDGLGMMLTVQNPFKKPLRYNIAMMPVPENDFYQTSSCPVIPGGSVFELWPYPIQALIFENLRLLKEGEDTGCVE